MPLRPTINRDFWPTQMADEVDLAPQRVVPPGAGELGQLYAAVRNAFRTAGLATPDLDARLLVTETLRVTTAQLLADLAAGYDAIVMGADKWHQIHDVAYYDDEPARDAALASLPRPLVVPRGDLHVPAHHRLDVDDTHRVSSTAARAGRRDLMLDAARRHDDATGNWTGRDGTRRRTGSRSSDTDQ